MKKNQRKWWLIVVFLLIFFCIMFMSVLCLKFAFNLMPIIKRLPISISVFNR